MKRSPVILGIAATMSLTACGSQGQDIAWFEENCAVQVADVRESFANGKPTGEVISQAMTHGPIKPPAGLEDSQYTRIGLYTYDELSGAMELKREVNADDIFCLEPELKDAERRLTIDTRENQVEGDLHGDVYEADFTLLRSEEYPEGIWMGLPASDLPAGIEVTESMPEQCELQWWVTKEVDWTGAKKSSKDISGSIIKSAEC